MYWQMVNVIYRVLEEWMETEVHFINYAIEYCMLKYFGDWGTVKKNITKVNN